MSKKIIPILLIILAVGGWYGYSNYYVAETDNSVIYGNIDIREVKPAFRQSGRIEHMYVEDGALVKKGDLLAEIDSVPFRREVDLALAKLAVADARLADLIKGPRAQEIESAHQEVVRLEATLRNAKYQYNRQKGLIKSGATSADNLDNAQAHYSETSAALAAAKQRMSLLQEGTKAETLTIAQQEVGVAKAELAIKETALEDTKLYAPENGVVLTRILEPGSMVNAGNPVISLSLKNPTYVRAYIAETMLGNISPGDLVTIHTDSNGQTFEGQIGFISPKAEFTPKTVETPELRTSLVYRIRIVVRGDDKGLNQGQPVTISL
ncbi:HlyD family efflux transporter periplasmic adaptor subunit [Vibrio sp. SCSIO 43137]|uniref:HlyD family efflux transporter periplasmic adaptor subunit n=1 Tax=Vibrio sp. SCSIO 43137 TaxID=3021011 RepID=UPI0023072639|nr:HlyD family efflux transporter periplasmic adaptor subunit [Vibrio sp. SCSIO 43137]WCE31906.1 efflux RND transporter periplasmic adaptor subunit [Vibrio sp. SCSIO 43137]